MENIDRSSVTEFKASGWYLLWAFLSTVIFVAVLFSKADGLELKPMILIFFAAITFVMVKSFFTNKIVLTPNGLLFKNIFTEQNFDWSSIVIQDSKQGFALFWSSEITPLVRWFDLRNKKSYQIRAMQFSNVKNIAKAMQEYKNKYAK